MAGEEQAGPPGREYEPSDISPDVVTAAAQLEAQEVADDRSRPAWVDRFVWSVLAKTVVVVLATLALLRLALETRHLLWLLAISLFFALAMIPAVDHIHRRWGWRRGAAVGLIYVATIVFVVLMVAVLIPAILDFADQVRANGADWIGQLNSLSQDVIGERLVGRGPADQAALVTHSSVTGWADNLLGLAASGVGVFFDATAIAMFTFYLAADYPRLERAVLSRLRPERQRVYGWISDMSIRQTGTYFYTRLLLTVINGGLSFVVMLLLGLRLEYAIPMALFMGFVSEFIPAIGTYLGAAIPILVLLAVKGLVPAVVLLIWVVAYQQVENIFLSPRLSAKTMEINGAVAFGSALAGGAIGGPIGAFMAMPVAALITAIVKNSGKTYDVVYDNKYGKIDAP